MNSVGGPVALAFDTLGLSVDADARAVRQAYARRLKQIDPSVEIQAFQELRDAYELALAVVRLPSADTHRNASPAETVPQTTPDVPESAIGELAHRLAGIAGRSEAASALQQACETLVSLEARARLEQWVADLLASGWQPGHEFLFEAASDAFHWTQDLRYLRRLGIAGDVLMEALMERQAFLDQPDGVIDRQLRLVHRLRDAAPPSPTLRRDERPLLELLIRRYPHWLGIVTSRTHVERWLGGAEALQALLYEPPTERPAEKSTPLLIALEVIVFVAAACFVVGRHIG